MPGGLLIVRTANAPKVNGNPNDDATWAQATPVSIGNVIVGSVTAASDLSGQFRALWNDEALFIRIDVKDEKLVTDSMYPWDDDSPEIYIDADRSAGMKYDGVNDFQFVFPIDNNKVVEVAQSRTMGVQRNIDLQTGTYRLVVKFPWSTLKTTAIPGKAIGLDIHLNDDDDGGARDGKLSWFGTIDQAWTRPDLFSAATLMP
jgi:oligosaccharide reducing-end xylanase